MPKLGRSLAGLLGHGLQWPMHLGLKGTLVVLAREYLVKAFHAHENRERISTHCVFRLERRTAWNSEARAQHTQYASPASNYTTRTVPQSRPTDQPSNRPYRGPKHSEPLNENEFKKPILIL